MPRKTSVSPPASSATRLLNHIIYDTEPDFDFVGELEENVIRLAERLAFGPSTGAIVSEAERRGIPVLRLDPRRSFVQLGHGAYQKRVWATVTSATADISVDVAGNKELTNRLLHEIGIPVPRADVVRSAEEAAEVARRIGYPVVLKPLDGNHGRGVMINLPDEAAVREAFPAAKRESRNGRSWSRRSSPARTTASWSSTIRWSPLPSGCRPTSSAMVRTRSPS